MRIGGLRVLRWVLVGFGLPVLAALALAPGAFGVTFVVTSADDVDDEFCDPLGHCSLREAINASNTSAERDEIQFNVDTGLLTITPGGPLPQITDGVVINGFSQPGGEGDPNVQLSGTEAGEAAIGLEIVSSGSNVGGLIINGFTFDGIRIENATDNVVDGNWIGLSGTGLEALANNGYGVLIQGGADQNSVGIPDGRGNVISGNGFSGIGVFGEGTVGNSIRFNRIGLNSDANAPIPNAASGVVVNDASDTEIRDNFISGNEADGVLIAGAAAGTVVTGNRITSNGGLGIEISPPEGPNGNDAGDADEGPNGLQNSPALESATTDGSSVTVSGALDSIGDTTYRLEFYSSGSCDASGSGEGNLFVGTSDVQTGAFSFTYGVAVFPGSVITATATAPNGDTSEFSNCATVEGEGGDPPSLVVNSANDALDETGCTVAHCSLREAIIAANGQEGGTVTFAIPGEGVHTIAPTSALPAVQSGVTIDGYSQPGAERNAGEGNGTSATIVIELSGTNVAGSEAPPGLQLSGSNNTVEGLAIGGGFLYGIEVGGSGNVVRGNFIGTDAAGTSARTNRIYGVIVRGGASGNQIGGPEPAERNLISGNTGNAGDNGTGVGVGTGSNENVVRGNTIGTARDGTTPLPNARGVIILSGAFGNAVSDNLVAENSGDGVLIQQSGSDGNTIEGNDILSNAGPGVAISGDMVDGPEGNQISGNTIASNGGDGVTIFGGTPAPRRNSILGNTIQTNGGLGIDLGPNGVTANDSGDGDAGENDLQNFPVIETAQDVEGGLDLAGELSSANAATYTLEFFANVACDPSGNGEGQTFLGSRSLTTNSDGQASFAFSFEGSQSGAFITATATDAVGNTSEYSECVEVAEEGGGTIDNLEITVDRLSIPAGIKSVPLASIPPSRIPFFAGAPATGPGSLPLADVPLADVPLADVGLATSAVGGLTLGDIGLGTIADAQLEDVLLSSIAGPLDAVLAQFPGRPAHTLTLRDVFADAEAAAAFRQLTLAQTGLGQTLLRGTRVVSLLVGTKAASFWCAELTQAGLPCGPLATAAGTLLSADVGGADISSSGIGSLPLADVPLADVPLADVPLADVTLGSSRLGDILIRNLASPNAVVDCARIDCAATSTRTLADAAALSPTAIRPTATFADLAGAFGNVTIDEAVLSILLRSEYPWGALPLGGLQDVAGTGDLAEYQVDADVACAVSSITVTVALPPGFFPKNGTSELAIGAATGTPIANPTRLSGDFDDVETPQVRFRWSGLSIPACAPGTLSRHVSVSFDAFAGLELGLFESTATMSGGSVSRTETGAPITVAENWEANDTGQATANMPLDTIAVVHLASSLDREYFRVDNPPRGWRTKIYLEQVPDDADFDLVATTAAPNSLVSAPLADVSLGSAVLTDPGTSLSNNPDDSLGAEVLQDVPSPSSTPLADVPLADVPLADVPLADVPLADVSAKRGDDDESVVLFSNGEPGTITIGVSGYNGSFSSEPAILRVRRIPPPAIPACQPRTFEFDPSPYSGGDESLPALPSSLPAATRSLLLVARNRMQDLYGEAATTAMLTSLNSVAAHPEVAGAVLFVDSDPAVRAALQAWDANPCSVDLANDVVRKINAVVARYRPGLPHLRYVVAHGSDEAFPYTRVPDLVTLSPESNYAGSLAFTTQNLTRGNALFASSALGYVLTDNPLGTLTKIDWLNRELYLPSISVSRMVETPGEIAGQYQQFLASNGLLDAATTSALTGSIDFLAEAGAAVAAGAATRAGGGVTTLAANVAWDSAAVLTGVAGKKLWSVNAHMDHSRLQPAALSGGLLTSSQLLPVVPDGSVPDFAGLVSFTAGCHAGLNVGNTLGGDAARLRDLPQASAQQRAAVYLANLGYGYGETAPGGNGLSEKWISLFAETLGEDTTFGEKKVAADHAYFDQMGTYGVYDEKALIEVASYGPPWYKFGTGTPPPAHTPPDAPVDPSTGLATATIPLNIASTLERHDDPQRGAFWTSNSDAHFAHYRVPQPVLTRNVSRPGERARGVALTALSTQDFTVDPFFSTPIVFSAANEPEPTYTDSTYPANFAGINSTFPFGQAHDTLVFLAGQFRAPNVQRLINSATVQVFYSSSSDVSPPLFLQSGSVLNGDGTATIFSKVVDRGTGIKKVTALYTEGGADGWHFVTLNPAGGALYTRTVSVGGAIHAMHWAVDGGGNVGNSTDKGFLFTSQPPDAGEPTIQIDQPLDGGVYTLGAVVPARYACSDAGAIASCTGTVANRQPFDTSTVGPHTFSVTATDLSGNVVTLEVTYRVGYGFSGFLAPVDNPPALNQATAGRTVPIRWKLRNGSGGFITSLNAVSSITSRPIPCDSRPVEQVPDSDSTAPSELKVNADGEFIYTWRTDRTWAGTCRRLTVTLNDGTAPFVDFRFR